MPFKASGLLVLSPVDMGALSAWEASSTQSNHHVSWHCPVWEQTEAQVLVGCQQYAVSIDSSPGKPASQHGPLFPVLSLLWWRSITAPSPSPCASRVWWKRSSHCSFSISCIKQGATKPISCVTQGDSSHQEQALVVLTQLRRKTWRKNVQRNIWTIKCELWRLQN